MSKDDYGSVLLCFRCGKNIPLLHSTWVGVNIHEKVYWMVTYCPRCGTVTDVEQSPFYYGNLLPRIGKVKSFLFVSLLLGAPFHLATWVLGGMDLGICFSALILLLGVLVSRSKIHQVEFCPYTRWEQYGELVRR